MTLEELYKAHEDEPQDGGRGYHSWQIAIFDRVLDKIGDDEEAFTLLKHTIEYAGSKARVAGM